MQNFLSGRSQAVRVGSSLSASADVTSGVIQGSSLGPILFNIFLDGLLNDLDIPASAYADDLKFIANLVRHSFVKIQSNINRVYDWSVAMDMPLSIEKCLVLHCGSNNPQYQYQCGSGVLSATDSAADLGITRSADGTYSEHISTVAQKGRRLVGMCFRGIQSRDPMFLMRVYRTYILPVLSYASPIWTPYLRQDVEELESVQRRFTKRLVGMKSCSYGTRLRNLSLLSLESQRK